MLDLATTTHERFAAYLEQHFTIKDAKAGDLQLELLEVQARTAHDATLRTPFSLLFRGPAEPLLGQGMRAMSNDTLGPFELFLVPVGLDAQGALYEAVFN